MQAETYSQWWGMGNRGVCMCVCTGPVCMCMLSEVRFYIRVTHVSFSKWICNACVKVPFPAGTHIHILKNKPPTYHLRCISQTLLLKFAVGSFCLRLLTVRIITQSFLDELLNNTLPFVQHWCRVHAISMSTSRKASCMCVFSPCSH